MGGGDFVGGGEVGDGAGEFDDAVMGAGGEVHLTGGGAHQLLARRVERAVLAYLAGAHVGVRDARRARKAGALAGAGRFDAPTHGGRGFRRADGGQLLVGDARHVEMDVNAVEQGAADPLRVAADLLVRAGAGALAVARVAARASVQLAIRPPSRCNEH